MTRVIIDDPTLQPRFQRVMGSFFTCIAWLLWLYMMAPLFAWFFEVLEIDVHVVRAFRIPHGTRFAIAFFAFFVVWTIGGLVWTAYNVRRFGRANRRTGRAPAVRAASIRKAFALSPRGAATLKQSQRVHLLLGRDGMVEECTWESAAIEGGRLRSPMLRRVDAIEPSGN